MQHFFMNLFLCDIVCIGNWILDTIRLLHSILLYYVFGIPPLRNMGAFCDLTDFQANKTSKLLKELNIKF